MNLDELKTAWKEYDRRLQSTQALNDRIITSMIKERSMSRLSRVQRAYMALFIYLLVILSFCVAVFYGNPFDFIYAIQYAPIIIYMGCILVFMISLITVYGGLRKININRESLHASLKMIIRIYDKPRKLVGWAGLVILSVTVLFPLSFLPRSIQTYGLWKGMLMQTIPMALSGLMILIAFKVGAFKDRFREKFKSDLQELNELKALSDELANIG
jgi:hypothetical protein